MKRVVHLLWHSQGGIRRHVRSIAADPPGGFETVGVCGPRDLADYFADVPFEATSALGLLSAGRDADVIHAHGVTAGIAALRPGGPPVVLSLHVVVGGSGRTSDSRLMSRAAKLIASRADAVVAVSANAARGFPRARVIAPVFDPLPPPTKDRDAVRKELGTPSEAIVAVCVSRLESKKRLDVFIRAVEQAGCVGWIAGDGPARDEIVELARGTRTQVLGYRCDVADILGAADVFALPSGSESYGIAVAEAIDAGLAVVATRTGAVEELVGEAGVLVAHDDEAAFIQGVRYLADDPEVRARLRAATQTVRRPDRAASVKALGDLYNEVIG